MRSAAIGTGAALIILLMVTGCGHSPPVRYVTLSAEPAVTPHTATRLQPVQLTAVHIPAELDRPELVTQTSANQLAIHENDRWGAPLGQMMRRTLAQDLLTRLPQGSFVLPDAPAPPDTRKLVVTVLNAEAGASGTLALQASWTLLSGPSSHTVLTQQVSLTSDMAGGDATAQAAALSHLLGQLADRISASIVAR
jgi:uncharacterized lipoprotein YmbA